MMHRAGYEFAGQKLFHKAASFLPPLLKFHASNQISRLVCPAPQPTMQYLQPKIFVTFTVLTELGKTAKY